MLMNRILIGTLAALPWLLLQLIYLTDITGWDDFLSYGGFLIVFALIFFGWLTSTIAESVLRRKTKQFRHRIPWLSVNVLVFLILAPIMIALAKPIVYQVPSWCRVYQSIQWDTSLPHSTHAGNQGFALVFVARGNITENAFRSGYLNYSGDAPAGFSDIDLNQQEFSYWENGKQVRLPLSMQSLHKRIRQAKIPNVEADRIANEIWHAIDLAGSDLPLTAKTGRVSAIGQSSFDYEEIKLGAVAWMVLLILTTAIVGLCSLPRSEQADTNNE